MQRSAIIIDDELQSRRFLSNALQQYLPAIRLIGEAATVKEGLNEINTLDPDIVFLDIQMNGETGFDLLQQLPHIGFSLIFTTAFDNYALKAFRFNAVDYLLKPIIAKELVEAITRIEQRNNRDGSDAKLQVNELYQQLKNQQKSPDKIAVPTPDGFLIVPVKEIVYCVAKSNYTEFHVSDKKSLLSSYTLKQYDELLPSQLFFRVHRSYLINLDHVRMFRRSDCEIVMSNGDVIELSRAHKEEFLQLLNLR